MPAEESVTKKIKGFNSLTIISTVSSTASSSARRSLALAAAFLTVTKNALAFNEYSVPTVQANPFTLVISAIISLL